MITSYQRHSHSSNDRFLELLPQIRDQARMAFRGLRPEAREDRIAEVTANAFCAFSRLVQRGKEDLAYATPLAQFAIRQVRAGRRVGTRLSVRDVNSRHGQTIHGITVERLDQYKAEEGEWQEVLIEDRRAGPAETAAARIDVAAWFRTLARRRRAIARALARSEATSTVAAMFGLTAGRISQLRQEFKRSWELFQGEPVAA